MDNKTKEKFRTDTGFTLIEVIIAMVIFALVSVSLLSAITTADKIKSRGSSVLSVSVLARNESESIKNICQLNGDLNDTTYNVIYNKKEFTVERKIVEDFETDPLESKSNKINEVEIIISEKMKVSDQWHFKLLQGYVN